MQGVKLEWRRCGDALSVGSKVGAAVMVAARQV